MKTLSVLLFTLILSLAIQLNLSQNSLIAQEIDPNSIPVNGPVCVDCGHNPCTCNSGESENNESNYSNENRLSLIDRLINLIFGNNNTDADEKERLLKEQQEELEKIAAENEEQRLLKEKIAKELHDKLMALYKPLPGKKELKLKKLSDYYKDKDEKNRAAILKATQDSVDKTIYDDKTKYKTQLERLAEIKTEVPPLFKVWDEKKERIVKSGFIMGLFNQESDYKSTNKLKDPKTGIPYKEGEYFCGTDSASNSELYRGVKDSWTMGEYTLSTDYGKKLVKRINGTHFNTLTAHSNGATITEALIRNGHIKVDELNIIGGDRSLMNNDGYNELIQTYGVKKIVVWVNFIDPVPYGSSALRLIKNIKNAKKGTNEENPDYNADYAELFKKYVDYSLRGLGQKNPNIEYRFMSGCPYKDHDYDCYFEEMKNYWENNGSK